MAGEIKSRPKKGSIKKMLGLQGYLKDKSMESLDHRILSFDAFIQDLKNKEEHNYFRLIESPPGREIIVRDEKSQIKHKMIMFGSNNYLGFGNHPYVKSRVKEAIDTFGSGLGGPAILNGYTVLMKRLEQRISILKHQEDAIIFPAGYNANLGFVSALITDKDLIIYDELCHASFYDALRLGNVKGIKFKHNDLNELESILIKYASMVEGRIWVCMEGVYSMDGDFAPLSEMIPMIRKYGAYSMLDDAHGTGVIGKDGSGTAAYFGVSKEIDISMGTFSKSFAVTGGFLSGSKEIINYMRYFARPYMFSASLPPMTLAAILAGLDLIEKEPELIKSLQKNILYANKILSSYGFESNTSTPIISFIVPEWMNIRKANALIHRYGIFLNAIEYPAVPKNKQRFRISLMAQHTQEDIQKLGEVLDLVWKDKRVRLK